MKNLLFALLFVLCGCMIDATVHTKTQQIYDGPEVFNVEHDGHKFIVFRQNYYQNAVSMFVIQHPDDGKLEKETK